MTDTFTTGQMARKLHKSVKTLQAWDRAGILVAGRTPTGRRFYTREQLLEYFGEKVEDSTKDVIAYCRVSSQAQKPDLRNQRKALEDFVSARGISGVEFVEEVGGGMNFKRKKLRDILRRVHTGEVSRLLVTHEDRLARFGFDHIAWQCAEFGCVVEVLNSEQTSPEQEMVQDLMTIVHCFSSRLYGLRNYRKTLKEARK